MDILKYFLEVEFLKNCQYTHNSKTSIYLFNKWEPTCMPDPILVTWLKKKEGKDKNLSHDAYTVVYKRVHFPGEGN